MDTAPSNASPDLRSKTPPGSPTLYPDLSKMIAPEKAVDVTNNPENGKRTTPVKNGAVSPADSTHSGVRMSPGFKSKAPPKSLFEKFTPKGCFDTLVRCEERGILEDIDKTVGEIVSHQPDPVVAHAYIDALLRGLKQVTEISVSPMKEILKDCRLDREKSKYLERIVNCYSRASLLSKLASFTDYIQEVCGESPDISKLSQEILQCLIDLNPLLAEIIESAEARTKDWNTEVELNNFVRDFITPPVKRAIKNLFLSTFNYKQERDDIFLEPNADSNDMRLNIHEERLQKCEEGLKKICVIGETVAREVADLKLAKAACAFATEEKCLRLNPQDREKWGKKTEEEKKKMIQDLVTQILNEDTSRKSNIRLIKESQRNPAWIKLFLPSPDDKFKFEKGLRDVRNLEAAKKKKSGERNNSFTSVRLTPMSFRNEERNMKRLAIQKLSNDWIEVLKNQKVSQYYETSLDRLETMWQTRLKWKSSPTFSVWLEVQDPVHRHHWMPIDMGRDNLFDLYDFLESIPEPKTREMADSDPSYLVPRHKSPREVDFNKRPRPVQTPSKGRNNSMGVDDLINKQNDSMNRKAHNSLLKGKDGKTPKRQGRFPKTLANQKPNYSSDVREGTLASNTESPLPKDRRTNGRNKVSDELDNLAEEEASNNHTESHDRSTHEKVDLDSSKEEEETETPKLPISSSEESLDESADNKEVQEINTEDQTALEIAATVPLSLKGINDVASIEDDQENPPETVNIDENTDTDSDEEDTKTGNEDSRELPTEDSHTGVTLEEVTVIQEPSAETPMKLDQASNGLEESKLGGSKKDKTPEPIGKPAITVDTELKTPGNSITVNSPMVTGQQTSPSVEQLKEIFEAEALEPKKSKRLKNKTSPRKSPEKSDEKPLTPTGVTSKAVNQMSIQAAMMNSGRKPKRRGAKQSMIKPPSTKGRNVNFQEED